MDQLTSFNTGIDSFSYQPIDARSGDYPASKATLPPSGNFVTEHVWKLQGFNENAEYKLLRSVGNLNESLPPFSPQESQELEMSTIKLLQAEAEKHPGDAEKLNAALAVINDTLGLRGLVSFTRSALQQV